MPRLLLFAPCEIAIVAQNGTLSLISIIAEFIQQNVPEILPENTGSVFRWMIVAEWLLTDVEMHLEWEQRLRLVSHAGELAMGLEHIAALNNVQSRHRMIAQLQAIPILPAGDYALEASIRQTGTQEWTSTSLYPLRFIRG
jgi:hypothetical protein